MKIFLSFQPFFNCFVFLFILTQKNEEPNVSLHYVTLGGIW
jgi:hypothetical protein